MFGLARLAAAILVRVGALFLFMATLMTHAAAGVTITGATPSTFSGPGQTITFHFRIDQENAIINSVALTMNHPLGAVSCSPALPIQPFETTNCTATYVTQLSNNFDIVQYGTYDLTTNGGPRGGNVAGQVTVTYVPPGVPSLSSISPTSGPVTGGTSVTITGINLNDVTSVTIGGTALIGTTVVNSTTIIGTMPANTAGSKNVTVTTLTGSSTLAGGFTYLTPTITLSPTSLPPATAGNAYSQSVTAAGGTAPYSFALTAGALPPGISLSAGGSLTGTPTTTGVYNFTVTATDANGFTGAGAYALSIAAPTITLAPATLSASVAGSVYAEGLSATGGTAPYSFALTAGALPPGMSLSAVGSLTGTPTTAGSFNFTVTATDTNGFTGARAYVLSISAPTITLAPATLPAAVAGSAYAEDISAAGGTAPYGFALTAGALPPGMSLSAVGSLTGTPTTAGVYNFTVTATDANGFTGARGYALSIAAPTITLAPSTLPAAVAGSAYTEGLSATGGTAPYSFALTAGALPPGMSLSAVGSLTGTPTTAGSFNFTVTAIDANGFTGARAYALSIDAPRITLTPSALPGDFGGVAYAQTLSASGGAAPYAYMVTAGTLPPGLNLSATGDLSGIPTTAGSFNFTVTATDANGFTGVQAYALSISAPTITLAPSTLPSSTGGIAYAQGLSATGGTAPYGFALTAGTLPAGLTLAADGSLTGTPTAAGSFNFTVTVTDAYGFTGARAYALSIGAPAITLAPSTLPGGTGGVAYAQGLSAAGGTAPYRFALTAGTLPTGLTLAADGSLTGTPSEAGSFAVTIKAADALGFTGSTSYTLVIDAPVPVASDRTVEILAGTTGRANLTDGATGSPFTGAAIVSHPPAAAGSASIEGSGGNYDLIFAATETASGAVAVTYTLSNAWGVSAPATITFSVMVRPDPSEDPEVIGLLTAQVDSARRLAAAQIGNFNGRLERLHNESDRRAASIDLRIGLQREDEPLAYAGEEGGVDARASGFPLGNPGAPAGNSGGAAGDSRIAFWAGGFVNFGSREGGAHDLDQTLVGVSAGLDWRFSPKFVGGIGIGYGRDAVDVGDNGTESEAQAFSAAIYGSYQPTAGIFLDGLLGFSRLEFDSHRFVTDTGGFAEGGRDGHQVFGSLSAGYEHRRGGLLLSPYARLQAAWSRLDAFTETGAGPYNLAFGDQDAEMLAGVLGLRLEYHMPTDWGTLVPRARLEYTHDFAGSSLASIGYADLSGGLPYALEIDPISRDYLSLQAGFDAELGADWQLGLDYRLNLGLDGDDHSHAVGLKIGANF